MVQDNNTALNISGNEASNESSAAEKPTPALSIPLSHVHLIEASAGTGKTWTLTALVVRLLLEAKRPPEQIIATTFTRAAAAEMRQRISQHISDMRNLVSKTLQALLSIKKNNGDDYFADKSAQQIYAEICKHLARDANVKDDLNDPLYAYILQLLIGEEVADAEHRTTAISQPANNSNAANSNAVKPADDAKKTKAASKNTASAKRGLLWAKNHLDVTLIQLDKLFVSTLDSLCQKLLREFAFEMLIGESGSTGGKPLELIQGSELDSVVQNLAHDAIRIWRTQQHQKNPKLMDVLAQAGKLTDVDDVIKCVNTGLNFLAEPMEPVADVQVDFVKLDNLLEKLSKVDDAFLNDYLDSSGAYYELLNGNKPLKKYGEYYGSMKQKMLTYKSTAITKFAEKPGDFKSDYLSKEEIQIFRAFYLHAEQFKKLKAADYHIYEKLAEAEVTQLWVKIYETLEQIVNQLDALQVHQNDYVTRYVRRHLAPVLTAQGKTTFSLQLRMLNEALEGESGKVLAQQIRHRYPVALIDEFQDVNADQAGMIYKIYQEHVTEDELSRGCVLLVGDPKQAIYGFRGGDIVNYQRIKASIPTQNHHTLDTNRRSQKALIESLNAFFGSREDMLENVSFDPVNAHGVSDILVDEQGRPVAGLVRHFTTAKPAKSDADSDSDVATNQSENNADAPELMPALADKITQLLSTYKIKKQDGTLTPIKPSDIAVLYRSIFDIHGLEYQLHKRGVPTFAGNSMSVFCTITAEDMAAVMQAMLKPQQLSVVRRALANQFFGLAKLALDALLDDESAHEDKSAGIRGGALQIGASQAGGTDSAAADAQPFSSLADIQFQFSEAAKTWQRYGFLAAWQQLATHFGIWQRLASLEDGERYLVDVRHLLEMMQTQAGSHTSSSGESNAQENAKERAQLHWYLRQLNIQPDEEWALQRRLPSSDGVKLMTIHKSKGLEFPIVFVVGADNTTKDKKPLKDLYLTTIGEGQQKRILLTANAGTDDEKRAADFARSHAEGMRVTYVAFTRPAQLLYMVTKDDLAKGLIKDAHKKSLSHWLVEDKALRQEVFDVFIPEKISQLSGASYTEAQVGDEVDLQSPPPEKPSKTHFRAWQNTSFSALARQLDDSHIDSEATEYALEGMLEEQATQDVTDVVEFEDIQSAQTIKSTQTTQSTQSMQSVPSSQAVPECEDDKLAMRFKFPRGANAGSFLHKVFEKLDFANPKQAGWLINSVAANFGIEHEFTRMGEQWDDLAQSHTLTWLIKVLQTKLYSGVCLQDVPSNKRLPEMSFNLGLSSNSFSANRLSALLQSEGLPITLPPQHKIYRYLVGEIDLVYEAGGRYFVLDYKSNHLGSSFADYSQDAVQHTMNHAGYWLQAAIYLVALHRYLQVRLPNYDPAQHLGGVEYAFIRGMHPEHAVDGKPTGVIGWQPSADFVVKLDTVFGGAVAQEMLPIDE